MKKQLTRVTKVNVISGRKRPANTTKLLGSLVQGQRRLLARRRGRLLKPSAPLIRQARRERTTHLQQLHD